METHPLISVIVPVYNVENYIEQCVSSIQNQTYKNLEIILVDDGSPDNCGAVCDRLALSDPRIKVFHKPNGGLSDARNYGLSKASGTYITYIDSDDYVSDLLVQYLMSLIERYDADISCCGHIKTPSRNTEFPEPEYGAIAFSGRDACKFVFEPGNELKMTTAWGKLYKKTIADRFQYPVGRKYEDSATTHKYLYISSTVVIGDAALYAYFQNPEGICETAKKEKPVDRLWGLSQRALFFEKKEDAECARNAWELAIQAAYADSVAFDGRCDGELRDIMKSRWFSHTISLKMKVRMALYLASPRMFRNLRKKL